MPLHRDIHWIGRQWAVTGHGMQLIDQKLQGFFDIEVARLWDEILIESVHAKEWLNRADFDKGLAIARARYPQPAGSATPPRQAAPLPAIESVAPLPPVMKPEDAKRGTLKLGAPEPVTVTLKHRPVKTPAAVTPAPQVTSPRTVVPAARPSPPPPAAERSAPRPVVPTPIKPASVEPPRAAVELKAPAITTRDPVEPPQPPSLFQMRYEGRARFVRPWRVVARKI